MTQSPRKTSGRKPLSASFIARVGLMATLALIFSYVEAIIPYNPGVPGIKLGIANVVTVVALYKFGAKDAVAVSVIRVVLAGLLFNGLFGMLYALAGAAVRHDTPQKNRPLFSDRCQYGCGSPSQSGPAAGGCCPDRGPSHILLFPSSNVQRYRRRYPCRHRICSCAPGTALISRRHDRRHHRRLRHLHDHHRHRHCRRHPRRQRHFHPHPPPPL